jgi:polysaccharide biosynthesis/export protein
LKILKSLGLLLFLSACGLPRGAALQSEILATDGDTPADFAVYQVTKSELAKFASWPKTGSFRSYGWFSTSGTANGIIIAPNDRIDLTIWDSEENSLLTAPSQKAVDMKDLLVSESGMIFIPYLETIKVSGLSPDQARKKMQMALKTIIPSAQVQISVRQGTRSSVDLVGGVSSPGTYPLTDNRLTVLNLLSLGGGVAPSLRNPQVRLVRGGKIYGTSLENLYALPKLDARIKGGDKVIISADKRYFRALGAAGTESIVYFETARPTALDAMSMIGGLSDSRADPKGILILREYSHSAVRKNGRGPSQKRAVFSIDLTTADGLFSAGRFYIQPEDTVLITEASITNTRTILGLVGSIFGIFNAAVK